MGVFNWLGKSNKITQSFNFTKEDAGWRSLTGNNDHDLSPLQHSRMLKIADYLDSSNGLAQAILNIPNRHVFSNGFRLDAGDHQTFVDDFMNHGGNQLSRLFSGKIRELRLLGEACWPYFLDRNGVMVLGYISPFLIDSVVTDPNNGLFPIGLNIKISGSSKMRKFRIHQPAEAISPEGLKLAERFADGNCFYFAVNRAQYGSRGRSVLLPKMDELDLYKKNLISESKSYIAQRKVVWDVELKGLNPEQINERVQSISIPTQESVRIHNEAEKWTALAPPSNANNSNEFSRLQLRDILGTYSIPEHWLSNGGDTNRATAEAMNEPTKKMLESIQAEVGHILVYLAKAAVLLRNKKLKSTDVLIKCVWPPLVNKDNSKIASGFTTAVNGAASAVYNGFLSRETAIKIIALSAAAFGLEIDPEIEFVKAASEAKAKAAEDEFSLKNSQK